jgi:hypothetical protein
MQNHNQPLSILALESTATPLMKISAQNLLNVPFDYQCDQEPRLFFITDTHLATSEHQPTLTFFATAKRVTILK